MLLEPIRHFIKLSDYTYKLVKKCCEGDRIIDALFHFPVKLLRRTDIFSDLTSGDKFTVVITATEHFPPSRKGHPYKIFGLTKNGDTIAVVYFNFRAPYLRTAYPIGSVVTISGNAEKTYEGIIQITHPDVVVKNDLSKYYVGLEPIYPLTGNLTNRTLSFIIDSVQKTATLSEDWIPQKFREKYNLPTFMQALQQIHHPKNEADLYPTSKARQRIAIDELLANQVRLKQIRESLESLQAIKIEPTGELFSKLNLPFELTDDQKKCFEDIKQDLRSGYLMNRLIQGDVGSGKTIVAFLGMLVAIENGFQTAFLAPTEILAWQHFETLLALTEPLGIEIDVMLSSNRKARKRQVSDLQRGATKILVGTHAILEENIEFPNLGFVVIDEQHRFGVNQRMTLIQKCRYPNVLTMSATPIPRTLLLGCYGDIDVSIIKTKPKGRIPIETSVVSNDKVGALVERLKSVDSQVFWICPVIEKSETLVDVNTRCEYLQKMFPENQVRILHGKMKPAEKDLIMEQFKQNKFKLLVSTTVVEVGVDIPNANVIVIEHAERFGLAQLHQLRGRVGRGDQQAYCILIYYYPVSEVGRQRLHLMKSTTDGFVLSEEDLKLRGAGDILGKEQSGMNLLRFSDFSNNEKLLEIANEIAQAIDTNSQSTRYLCDIFNRVSDEYIV